MKISEHINEQMNQLQLPADNAPWQFSFRWLLGWMTFFCVSAGLFKIMRLETFLMTMPQVFVFSLFVPALTRIGLKQPRAVMYGLVLGLSTWSLCTWSFFGRRWAEVFFDPFSFLNLTHHLLLGVGVNLLAFKRWFGVLVVFGAALALIAPYFGWWLLVQIYGEG